MTVEQAVQRPALPLTVGPLIGRDSELAAVSTLLTEPGVRCIVLTGPSGVGKTALATAVLVVAPVEHRVLVPLGAVRDGKVMADAIASEVAPASRLAQRPVQALWHAFDGEPVLLLLDDLEQVDDAADVVRVILEGYPSAVVLATSVRDVRIPGERVVRLGPLPVHDGPGPISPAARMFVERMASRDVTGRMPPPDLAVVEQICRAVGGVPLAIELAAARAASLPLPLIAAQLSGTGGLALLETGDAHTEDRHRSLHAALAWTTGMLPPKAADLLAALSVFEGPASVEAVASVAPEGELVLDLLSTLLDVSLVELEGSATGETLFGLLPTVRAFAAELLAATGGATEALRRHDDYVRARCRAGTALEAHEVADVLVTVDRAQLDGSVDDALDLAMLAARTTESPGATVSLASRLEGLLVQPGKESVQEVRALVWSVAAHRQVDAIDDPRAFAAWTHERVERAIRAARTSGDVPALLDALELTIRTLPVTLDMQLAMSGITEGMAIAERSGDAARLARFRMWVGMAALAQGADQQAETLLRLAFDGGSTTRDRVAADYAAMHLHTMGITSSGDPDRPLPDLAQLFDSAWRHRDGFAAAVVLAELVRRSAQAGDVVSAAEYTSRLLPIGDQRRALEPLMAATTLTFAVRVLVAAGDLSAAGLVQSSLAPLAEPLRSSMPRRDHLAYGGAVEELEAASAGSPSPPREPPSIQEAFRIAERALSRLIRDAGRRPSPSTAGVDRHPPTPAAALERLTAREHEVLLLLAEGSGNRDIAESLGISTKTVMHHTVSIYRKLGVRGRTEAAAWAIRAGLTQSR